MSVNTIDFWKRYKADKQKIFATSYINNAMSNILEDKDILIQRLDINEVAKIYGLDDGRRLSFQDLSFILRTRKKSKSLFAVDVPLCETCGSDSFANIIKITQLYNVDFLCLSMNANNMNITKKLCLLNVPVIITADCASSNLTDERLVENIMEMGNTCASMVICENLAPAYYEKIKLSCKVPVLIDKPTKNADGYYMKYSDVIGMYESTNKFLNLNGLISGAFEDAMESVKI